jgi:hypothetical protein
MMSEQERLQEAQQALEVLKQNYGVEIVAVLQPEQLNGSLIQARAIPVLQFVQGWQPPAEPKDGQDSQPE